MVTASAMASFTAAILRLSAVEHVSHPNVSNVVRDNPTLELAGIDRTHTHPRTHTRTHAHTTPPTLSLWLVVFSSYVAAGRPL